MAAPTVVSNPAYAGQTSPSERESTHALTHAHTHTLSATHGLVGGHGHAHVLSHDHSGTVSEAAASELAGSHAGASVATASTAGTRSKSSLVLAAERMDRRTALLSGYLRKKNSANKWQKRYFEILGNYWVYYKSSSSTEMLCAMDLWKAGTPELVAPSADGGADASGESTEFAITWDRYRLFRAATHAEAVRWVNAILQVQASRPPELAGDRRIMNTFGRGGPGSSGPSSVAGSAALEDSTRDWGQSKDRPRAKEAGGSNGSGGGVCSSCTIM